MMFCANESSVVVSARRSHPATVRNELPRLSSSKRTPWFTTLGALRGALRTAAGLVLAAYKGDRFSAPIRKADQFANRMRKRRSGFCVVKLNKVTYETKNRATGR